MEFTARILPYSRLADFLCLLSSDNAVTRLMI